jgi:hypothetical protein
MQSSSSCYFLLFSISEHQDDQIQRLTLANEQDGYYCLGNMEPARAGSEQDRNDNMEIVGLDQKNDSTRGIESLISIANIDRKAEIAFVGHDSFANQSSGMKNGCDHQVNGLSGGQKVRLEL